MTELNVLIVYFMFRINSFKQEEKANICSKNSSIVATSTLFHSLWQTGTHAQKPEGPAYFHKHINPCNFSLQHQNQIFFQLVCGNNLMECVENITMCMQNTGNALFGREVKLSICQTNIHCSIVLCPFYCGCTHAIVPVKTRFCL